MKNKISFIIALIVLLTFVPFAGLFSAGAATVSGKCGDGLTWRLDGEGTLTVSGSGKMADYSYDNASSYSPWSAYKKNVKAVVIKSGATSIGDHAFDYCPKLTKVTIPNSVTSIGSCAFYNCEELKNVTVPSGITHIGDFALGYYCYETSECVYDPESNAYGYRVIKEDRVIDGFEIYCFEGTEGKSYAETNGITYDLLVRSLANGDVNGDGSIDATDIILVKRHFLGISLLSFNCFVNADADASGEIDFTDYLLLKRFILGIGWL